MYTGVYIYTYTHNMRRYIIVSYFVHHIIILYVIHVHTSHLSVAATPAPRHTGEGNYIHT